MQQNNFKENDKMDQITEISQNPKMFKNNVYQKLVEIWSIFYVLVKEDNCN